MSDIIIYTTPEKLLHKQDRLENDEDKSDEGCYYWEFRNMPKIKSGEKVYPFRIGNNCYRFFA